MKPNVIVSPRIADQAEPMVPADKERCSECGELVWLSHTIQEDLPVTTTILCRPCALPLMESSDSIVILPEVRRAMFGRNP